MNAPLMNAQLNLLGPGGQSVLMPHRLNLGARPVTKWDAPSLPASYSPDPLSGSVRGLVMEDGFQGRTNWPPLIMHQLVPRTKDLFEQTGLMLWKEGQRLLRSQPRDEGSGKKFTTVPLGDNTGNKWIVAEPKHTPTQIIYSGGGRYLEIRRLANRIDFSSGYDLSAEHPLLVTSYIGAAALDSQHSHEFSQAMANIDFYGPSLSALKVYLGTEDAPLFQVAAELFAVALGSGQISARKLKPQARLINIPAQEGLELAVHRNRIDSPTELNDVREFELNVDYRRAPFNALHIAAYIMPDGESILSLQLSKPMGRNPFRTNVFPFTVPINDLWNISTQEAENAV